MAVTADWQAELRGLLLGHGTQYLFAKPNLGGLGSPDVRKRDLPRADRDGLSAAADLLGARTIVIPLELLGTSASNGGALLDALNAAWRPAPVDVALDLRMPGWGAARRYYGRPRGVSVVGRLWREGVLSVLASFDALDPNAYGAEVTETDLSIANAGAVPTDRAIVTIAGNGGTPVLTNTSDDGGQILWATALAVGQTRVIDLHARTVVNGSGAGQFAELSPASSWFVLQPGTNTLTLTGATLTSVVFRPAYL